MPVCKKISGRSNFFLKNQKNISLLWVAVLLAVMTLTSSACARNVPAEDDLFAANASGHTPVKDTAPSGITSDGLLIYNGLTEKVLLTAYSQLGAPYRSGGTSPNRGFDCSGFTSWVYSQNGIQLPRSSKEQFQIGRPIEQEDLKPGDLVMYRRGRSSGTHIGIYAGNGVYIHSPSRGKTVMEANAFSRQANLRYMGARRVFEDPSSCPLTPEQKESAKKVLGADADSDIKVIFKPGKEPAFSADLKRVNSPAKASSVGKEFLKSKNRKSATTKKRS